MKVFRQIFLGVTAALGIASAQVTLGTSNQIVTFHTIGANVQGEGQSTVTWGNCVYDGKNTTCTVSGPFTAPAGTGLLSPGGTYNFVLTYPGNGPSPLTAISDNPGDNFTYFGLTAGSFTTSLTVNNGPTIPFYNPSFEYDFIQGSTSCTPSGTCSVGTLGLTPGNVITGPVNGTMTTVPVIRNSQGVITAGAYGGYSAIAPATWIEIYGTNLANVLVQNWAGTDFSGNNAPTALGGTTVTVGGKPAFIDYVSPGQVNAQVPSGVPSGSQQVVVSTAGGTSSAYLVTVNPTEPGLLAPSSFTVGGKQYVVALFSSTLTYVLPVSLAGVATERAHPGDSITLYGVGFGPVTPDTPGGVIDTSLDALSSFQVFFGGVPATVTYAGLAPGYVGLYVFNVVVPSVTASDTIPLTFSLNGTMGSQSLLISVQN